MTDKIEELNVGILVRVRRGDQAGERGRIKDMEVYPAAQGQPPMYLVGSHWYVADMLEVIEEDN